MQAEGYRPGEAAASLGVPASTLRLYSVRFGPLLSEAAAHPVEREGGRPGFRLYSEQDLAVLRDGKGLLEKGLTYEDAMRELRRRWRPRVVPRVASPVEAVREDLAQEGAPLHVVDLRQRPEAAVPVGPGPGAGERESAWAALVASLVANVNSAQALAEEWRRLVEDRNAEIATLRRRLREVEEAPRRSWWQRLFG